MKVATRISLSLLLVCYFSVVSELGSLTNALAQGDQFNARQKQRTVEEADISQHPRLIREFAKEAAKELQWEWSDTDWLSATPQYIGQIVPFLRLWRLHKAISGPNVGSILPGTNLGEQADHLLGMPASESIAGDPDHDGRIRYVNTRALG